MIRLIERSQGADYSSRVTSGYLFVRANISRNAWVDIQTEHNIIFIFQSCDDHSFPVQFPVWVH